MRLSHHWIQILELEETKEDQRILITKKNIWHTKKDHVHDIIEYPISIGDGVGEGSFSQSHSLIASVVDRVESLKERHAEDEAPGWDRTRTDVSKASNNQINFAGNTTNGSVKDARPDLSVRGEFEYNLIKKEIWV